MARARVGRQASKPRGEEEAVLQEYQLPQKNRSPDQAEHQRPVFWASGIMSKCEKEKLYYYWLPGSLDLRLSLRNAAQQKAGPHKKQC